MIKEIEESKTYTLVTILFIKCFVFELYYRAGYIIARSEATSYEVQAVQRVS